MPVPVCDQAPVHTAANNHLKEISPHLATHSSFQELPADEGPLPLLSSPAQPAQPEQQAHAWRAVGAAHANRVEKALDVVYASYFPVSRQWDLRTEGGTDGGRLMSEVDVTSVVNQRGGKSSSFSGALWQPALWLPAVVLGIGVWRLADPAVCHRPKESARSC